jgi:hypothetical protein
MAQWNLMLTEERSWERSDTNAGSYGSARQQARSSQTLLFAETLRMITQTSAENGVATQF